MARKQKFRNDPDPVQPELELADENTPNEVNVAVEEEKPAEVVVKNNDTDALGADEGIDILRERLQKAKEHLALERQARLEAERVASQANVEVKENQVHLVSNAIDILNRERDIIKHNIKELMQAGDYDRAVELQEMLLVTNNKLLELESGLQDMKKQPVQPQSREQSPNDIVDNLIGKVSGRSARWLDKNRDNLNSIKALRIMERAHGDALDNEIEADSDEYFRFIENRLGIGKQQPKYEAPDEDNEPIMSSASQAVTRRSAPPAAPVSRASQPGSPRQKQVTLTPEQAEHARISGLTNEQYYKQLLRIEEEQNSNTRH